MAKCNGCGCTDDRACGGGCEWVFVSATLNICSRCSGTTQDLRAALKATDKLLTAVLNGKPLVAATRYLVRQALKRDRDLDRATEISLAHALKPGPTKRTKKRKR